MYLMEGFTNVLEKQIYPKGPITLQGGGYQYFEKSIATCDFPGGGSLPPVPTLDPPMHSMEQCGFGTPGLRKLSLISTGFTLKRCCNLCHLLTVCIHNRLIGGQFKMQKEFILFLNF